MTTAAAKTARSGANMRHGRTPCAAPAGVSTSGASDAVAKSDPPARRRAEQALRRGQQRDDEERDHGDRREDAADEEGRGLLEDAEAEAADDRAAVVAQPAERHRDESVEIQERAVGDECQQQRAAG